ncbi:MAG: hypothetical protein HC869_24825 [Rhodospirillales bacterium]|nr:hypothetical protein [Rhodospirillales bacterium]
MRNVSGRSLPAYSISCVTVRLAIATPPPPCSPRPAGRCRPGGGRHGRCRGNPFVGLPGNPVAAFVTYCYVVRPVIARLSGSSLELPRTAPVKMGFGYRKKLGRREFVRVNLVSLPDGSVEARQFPKSGAGVLTSLTDADGLVVLPEDQADIESGSMVPFISYQALLQ